MTRSPTLLRLHPPINPRRKYPFIHKPPIILPHDFRTEDHPIFDELDVGRSEMREEE